MHVALLPPLRRATARLPGHGRAQVSLLLHHEVLDLSNPGVVRVVHPQDPEGVVGEVIETELLVGLGHDDQRTPAVPDALVIMAKASGTAGVRW